MVVRVSRLRVRGGPTVGEWFVRIRSRGGIVAQRRKIVQVQAVARVQARAQVRVRARVRRQAPSRGRSRDRTTVGVLTDTAVRPPVKLRTSQV
ncbi:hypothetical protein AQ490_08190 [Wenjunlia vitaminophila]|uniref:Uncharacterized protein n=1 Tax=Wenjunlia vitaminophila TaxID=76728 RepID=A0A0T6LMW0_WENVI|nr:hypothetical protein AQ490_08190 [Wenjunlia vitaminophila]